MSSQEREFEIGVQTGEKREGALVVLGVGAGIAAFKAVALLRMFEKAGYRVAAVPTPAALDFVGLATWEGLASEGVYVDTAQPGQVGAHVDLARRASLVVVCPATADLIAKVHAGLAPDMLTNVLLATSAPVVFAPAMHTQMWVSGATQRNVAQLRQWGMHVIEPVSGELSSGDYGAGRLPEVEQIFSYCSQLLEGVQPTSRVSLMRQTTGESVLAAPNLSPSQAAALEASEPLTRLDPSFEGESALADITATFPRVDAGSPLVEPGIELPDSETSLDAIWQGKRVVVSAGGTREPLDPVRFIGNKSSGLFGVELAIAFAKAGAEVTLLQANVRSVLLERAKQVAGVVLRDTPTAQEMFKAVQELNEATDVLIMSAAVADYRPAQTSEFKLKKSGSALGFFAQGDDEGELILKLVQNPDILAWAAQHKREGQLVVGFAAETGDNTEDFMEHGRAKAQRKGADVLLVNRVGEGIGFGEVDTQVYALDRAGNELTRWEGTKLQLSESIARFLAALL